MNTKIIYISKNTGLEKVRYEVLKARMVACDTETAAKSVVIKNVEYPGDGLNPYRSRIRLVQLSTVNYTFVIDAFKVSKAQLVNRVLKPLFRDEKIVKLFHNAKFDMKVMAVDFGIGTREMRSLYDTYIIARLCMGGLPNKCGLGELADDLLGIELPKENQKFDWSQELYREQIIYAGLDALMLFPLKAVLDKCLEDNRLHRVAKLELDAVPAFAQLELNGVLLNKKKWIELATASKIELDKAEATLREYVGDINLRSHQQVCGVLSTLLGRPIKSRAKDEIVKMVANYRPVSGQPDCLPMLEALQTWTIHNTHQTRYGMGMLDHIDIVTGRIHSNFKQATVETGRTASSDPNLQNIKRESEMRAAFIAGKGNKLAVYDYSQIELRLLANISGDVAMCQVFANKEDLHTATAIEVFGTKDKRQDAKCLAEGTMILTDRGEVPIENVTTRDSVWDGVEWVKHEGVIFQGYKETITYDKVTGTRDHVVYTKQIPRELGTLRSREKIARTAMFGIPIPYWRDTQVHWSDTWRRLLPTDPGTLLLLLTAILGWCRQPAAWKKYALFTKTKVTGYCELFVRCLVRTLCSMHISNESRMEELRTTWYQGLVQIKRTFHQLLPKILSPCYAGMRVTDRPQEQQWTLQTRQHSFCNPEHKQSKQERLRPSDVSGTKVPISHRCSRLFTKQIPRNKNLERDIVAPSGDGKLDGYPTNSLRSGIIQVQGVFDIVNAGPRHRFTANGRLVKNCINFGIPYGQQAEGLAEVTGMSKRDAQKKLDIYYAAHPEMTEWFDDQVRYMRAFDCVRTTSGRMRAVPYWRHGRNREFEAMQASRNTPIQGSSADILKLAMVYAHRELPEHWLMVLQVHDEIAFEIPKKDSAEAEQRIPELMIRAGQYFMPDVECTVEGQIGDVWKK